MLYHILLDKSSSIAVAIPAGVDADGMIYPSGLKQLLNVVGILNWIFFIGIVVVVVVGLINSQDVWKLIFAPLIGIAFAWTVFVTRSFDLLAKYLYKRKLRTYEKRGKLVIIPSGLLAEAEKACKKLGVAFYDVLFVYDLSKTRTLCLLYQKNRQSPDVQKQLELLIKHVPEQKKQKESPLIIRKYDLTVKGIANLVFYLSSLIGL